MTLLRCTALYLENKRYLELKKQLYTLFKIPSSCVAYTLSTIKDLSVLLSTVHASLHPPTERECGYWRIFPPSRSIDFYQWKILPSKGHDKYDPDGRFVHGRFVPTDVLSSRTSCPPDVLSPRTFCPRGRFVHGRFVSGRFVSGRFVWAPFIWFNTDIDSN